MMDTQQDKCQLCCDTEDQHQPAVAFHLMPVVRLRSGIYGFGSPCVLLSVGNPAEVIVARRNVAVFVWPRC